MKAMGWLIKRFIIGTFVLYFFNVVGVHFNIAMPLNALTAFLTGTLGIPGFILVFVLTKLVFI